MKEFVALGEMQKHMSNHSFPWKFLTLNVKQVWTLRKRRTEQCTSKIYLGKKGRILYNETETPPAEQPASTARATVSWGWCFDISSNRWLANNFALRALTSLFQSSKRPATIRQKVNNGHNI
jgi:hypothetical protein